MKHQSYEHGLALAGIETTPPIMRRGVLLDIPRLYGSEVLGERHEVTAQDLAEAQARQGSPVWAGDVLLVRTGWMRHWGDEALYGGPEYAPGLGDSACLWASERGAVYMGTDTVAFGRMEMGGAVGESHVILQYQHGIQIMEVVNLEELARDRVYEFLFIALPLKIRGGTASPIRPIAVI